MEEKESWLGMVVSFHSRIEHGVLSSELCEIMATHWNKKACWLKWLNVLPITTRLAQNKNHYLTPISKQSFDMLIFFCVIVNNHKAFVHSFILFLTWSPSLLALLYFTIHKFSKFQKSIGTKNHWPDAVLLSGNYDIPIGVLT